MIGMCVTGNFALSSVADDSVLAALSLQPAMLFSGPAAGGPAALHMSEAEIAEIKINIDRNEPIKAYRFENDWMSKQVKFDALAREFNTDGELVQMKVLVGSGDSVLIEDFVDQAGHPTYAASSEVLEYFQRVSVRR